MPAITIAIADDHPIIRASVRELLLEAGGFEVVGEAADGLEALAVLLDKVPDVLLLDLRMPNLSGMGVLKVVRKWSRRSRVLVFTASESQLEFLEAMRLGAAGVVRKNAPTEVLAQAVRRVHAGGVWLDDRCIRAAPDTVRGLHQAALATLGPWPNELRLTRREREVVEGVVQGHTNREIAARMAIRENTVSNHVSSILTKMNVKDRFELALAALHEGISPAPQEPDDGLDQEPGQRSWELGALLANELVSKD